MLETVNVKDTNEHFSAFFRLAIFTGQALIDNGNKPLEKTDIHEFCNRVADDGRLCRIQSCYDLLRARSDLLFDCPFLEIRLVNTQETGSQ